MLTNDIEAYLKPIEGEAPCGPDLEYDPAFLELERLAESKPEQQIGNSVVPAQEPDWRAVTERATALLAKTKDLRVAWHLVRGLLATKGFLGFHDGLGVLRGLVERHWADVYPRLDPDDDNDPTFRVNILMGLCDPAAVLDRVRNLPLVSARSFGRFSLRDLAIVSGEMSAPEGTEAPKATSIDGAFAECDLAQLQATADAVKGGLEHLTTLESVIGDQVGAGRAASFSKLADLLRQANKVLVARLEARGVGGGATADGAAADATGAVTGDGRPSGKPISGEISSREDVVRMLDKICAYYQRCEPSSPIPIFLERCKRLVTANFLDIIRDLAPDGLGQVELLRGRQEQEHE
jgi:type VI secretion system protein ImpA